MFQVHRFSHNALRRMAGIVVSFLIVGFCLVACGSNTTTGGGGQPTPTKPPQTVNCGNVQTHANKITPADQPAAQKAVNCFYSAYQKCQPAALMYSVYAVDTGTIHNLAVKNTNGSCAVTDGWQHFIAPKPASNAITYSCTGMAMQSDGLHLESCGQAGSFVIPLT